MKRSLLVAGSLLLVSVCVAQPSLLLKGGLNLAGMVEDRPGFMKTRLGVQFGAVAQKPIRGKFFFQPELLYSSKGYLFRPLGRRDLQPVLRLNYLSLPVQIGFQANRRLSVLFGPEVAYLLCAARDAERSVAFNERGYSRFDTGLDLGLTYQMSQRIGVDLRYNHGFHTFYFTSDDGVKYDDHKLANRVGQLGVVYRLK